MLSWLLLAAALPARAAIPPGFPAPARSTAPITVVFPAEQLSVPPTEGEWVLGSVSDPSGHLEINGSTIAVYRTGAFLGWLGVKPGSFTLHCALTLRSGATFTFDRTILVQAPPAPLPAKPTAIDASSLSPSSDMELRPGDWLVARMRASPGASRPQFRLGRGDWQPMRASNPGLGLYEGAYLIPLTARDADPAPVEFRIGWTKAASQGKVAVRASAPLVAAVRGTGPAEVYALPSQGDYFPALGGTRFLTAGRLGGQTKVRLGGGAQGWIQTADLEFLPPGAAPPHAVTDVVTVHSSSDASIVHIGLTDRVPFIVEESRDLRALTVRVHYASLHTNWIVYDPNDDFVGEIRAKQESSDVAAFTIILKPGRRLWGYEPSFDGSGLRLELRKPPAIGPKVLAGRVIFLDPGHMPSAPGAIGGLGTREMDVNYAIAKQVEKLLLKAGAKPIVSRKSQDDEVGLADRPRMALEQHAELFVSIHNNNFAGEINPFHGAAHGYSIFYYHPHSFELARDIHDAYAKLVPLPDEALRFGNLLVARMTAMPAVLTESAYISYPQQEELLLTPSFRAQVARAIVDGITAFLKAERARQLRARKRPAGHAR